MKIRDNGMFIVENENDPIEGLLEYVFSTFDNSFKLKESMNMVKESVENSLDEIRKEGIVNYRRNKATYSLNLSLETFFRGNNPSVWLIPALLLDTDTVHDLVFKMFDEDLEDYESVTQFTNILSELEKDLGITGNELDEFFAAKVRG